MLDIIFNDDFYAERHNKQYVDMFPACSKKGWLGLTKTLIRLITASFLYSIPSLPTDGTDESV